MREIREVVAEHGRLAVEVSTLADDADLYQAGMSSHASVNLMLALEDRFSVEFPERMLRRRTFESLTAILQSVQELRGDAGAPEASAGKHV